MEHDRDAYGPETGRVAHRGRGSRRGREEPGGFGEPGGRGERVPGGALPWHAIAVIAAMLVFCAATGLAVDTVHGPLDLECELCHEPGAWDRMRPDAGFDHGDTRFPLTGAHRAVSCRECHDGLRFAGTSDRCAGCHDDIHNRELGLDCARCHTTSSFTVTDDVSGFHETTRFPLRGMHRSLMCADCHDDASGRWRGLDTACVACHLDDWHATRNPDHAAVGFSTDCIRCHDETEGFRSTFDHASTGFPLTGMHALADCFDCHTGDTFAGLSPDCVSCHRGGYDHVTSPDHAAAGFPTACADCHTTSAWAPATWDHAVTGFPLEGAHAAASCDACHGGGTYAGTSPLCVSCHRTAYDAAAEPDHAALNFPLACADCHTTVSWVPATFDHDATGFSLTAAHIAVDCADCHTASYGLHPPTDCAVCHDADFTAVDTGAHTWAGASPSCDACHLSSATWQFVHARFPEDHKSADGVCSRCHPASSDLKQFTCFTCHPTDTHGKNYSSSQCLDCHPDGRD